MAWPTTYTCEATEIDRVKRLSLLFIFRSHTYLSARLLAIHDLPGVNLLYTNVTYVFPWPFFHYGLVAITERNSRDSQDTFHCLCVSSLLNSVPLLLPH
ncbi:hypothetical protein CGRA01v4_00344 [Colletotrichum graminicola]|nr:hypothetical protein CGRA01v4_00344 [Colletotrichum graminicola]